MLRTRILLASLLASGLALAVSPVARAGMIADANISPSGANFLWKYTVTVEGSQQVGTGDYFTIYDFQGALGDPYNPITSMPADWELLPVTNTTGLLGSKTTPNDDPTIPNYTYRYLGSSPLSAGWTGDFELTSLYDLVNISDFSFVATSYRTDYGRPYQNITAVEVPSPNGEEEPPPGGGEPPAESPEPATLVMLGCGLPVLGLLRRRKAAR